AHRNIYGNNSQISQDATQARMSSEEDYHPSDPELEGRWRRALETAGIHVVRARLTQSPGGPAATISGLGPEPISQSHVERWLRDQEAGIEQEAMRRHRQILIWTVIAAVAGIIAALTGIIAVVRG